MPLLKVNQIASYSGNTLTVGTTGDTVTLAAGASSSGFGFDGVVWTSNIVTSAFTASVNVGYFVNTSAAAVTVTLPASASNGDQIIFTDYNRKWSTNALTLNQNSLKFQGGTSPNPVYNTAGQTVQLVYADSTQGWIPTSDDNVTYETPQPYTVNFLVIAGGGGGGDRGGNGGGGAGGYRTTTQTISIGTTITVTVGDGGTYTNNGSNSSISGPGLTTITSAGGGAGGNNGLNGSSGGSGGGAGSTSQSLPYYPGGSGNTPSTSPSQGNNGGSNWGNDPYPTGGGGGAGTVGGNATSTTAGNGGAGSASSITGSSVTYAGGGGGGYYISTGSSGTGGSGGGGNGASSYNTNGSNGTVNTGGGGGGGAGTTGAPGGFGGTGGKGIVILSVPTDSYSGNTTGSPTITTSGSNTIVQFTGSGSYIG
jgi:hypothetical protein